MTFLSIIDREGRFGEWATSAYMLMIAFVLAAPGTLVDRHLRAW